ncbi:hypothetical protein J6590_086075 [Homalodisca vitripennis]|nr:hypothetical protein J6590_086075 [Homalodisca vitripennis]
MEWNSEIRWLPMLAQLSSPILSENTSSGKLFGQLVAHFTHELNDVVEKAVRAALSSVNDEVGRLQELLAILTKRLKELDDRLQGLRIWSSTRDVRNFAS